jgi:tetratricopeptide (TPR) repeat protein
MQNTDQKTSIGEKVNEFVQKNRKSIYISVGTVILLLLAGIATLSLMDFLRNSAISKVEDFTSRYERLRFSITADPPSSEVVTLLADIEAFARKNSGYAGGKAWSLIGIIRGEQKDWPQAEIAWAASAKAAKKTYLGPLALFNAGAAAEEQGKTKEAIEYYTSSLTSTVIFPAAPRAQFAIGRLRESLNENAEAIEAYNAVISGWPYDQTWVNLAHSRIIFLEAK